MNHYQTLVISLVILFASHSLEAQQGGWDLTLGVGIFGENVYVGSDDYYVAPIPTFKASYTKAEFSYYISLLEGLGVTYMNQDYGLLASVTLNAGGTRDFKEYSVVGVPVKHSDRTRKLLENSPNLSTPIAISTMLAYPTPVGIFGASLDYHPTTVKYDRPGIEDKVQHGFLYSILYMIEIPATNQLSFSGMFSVEFMDKNYADAWYTIEHETRTLDTFEAEAGLRSTLVALEVTYNFSKHVGMSVMGANTILLEDARKSPYTVERHQLTMTFQTFYNF